MYNRRIRLPSSSYRVCPPRTCLSTLRRLWKVHVASDCIQQFLCQAPVDDMANDHSWMWVHKTSTTLPRTAHRHFNHFIIVLQGMNRPMAFFGLVIIACSHFNQWKTYQCVCDNCSRSISLISNTYVHNDRRNGRCFRNLTLYVKRC